MVPWAMRMNPNLSGAQATEAVYVSDTSTDPGVDYDLSTPTIFAQTTFDYIIVGGGTAGLTLAARLAKNKGVTVGVIEAGRSRPNDPLINTPGFYGQSSGNKDYDWAFKTTSQPNLAGRSLTSSAGRVLGGSSAINYLVLMRASAPEYDAWYKFGGDHWNWKGLLPYFKKIQNYVAPTWGFDAVFPGITKAEDDDARRREPDFEGYAGPIQHTFNELYTDALKPFILTLNELGIKTNRTPDYGDSTGIFNISTAVDRSSGIRSYAASAYFNPVTRPKVYLLTETTVTKILFSPKSHDELVTATGVEFVRPFPSQCHWKLKAHEVILSAGALNTPKLLELSGIGNPNIINRLGIPTIVDLPGVGENLQDHLMVNSDFVAKDGIYSFDALRVNQVYAQQQAERYKTTKDGAYATTVSAYGFLKLDQILPASEVAQMRKELDEELKTTEQTPLQKLQYELQKNFLDKSDVGDVEIIMVPHVFATSPPAEDTYYTALAAAIVHPFSRGSVHISNNDPFCDPTVNPNYLHSAFDAKCLTVTTKFMREVANAEPLKSLLKGPSTPPPSTTTYAQFEKFVRERAVSVQHPIGTAVLAPREIGGVVDSKLLVYGTKNLRVADLSIAPLHIAAHTCDTAYAIGEKAYDLMMLRDGS